MRLPHLIVVALSLLACGTALSQPERRLQLEFSGMTSASPALIQDVMMNVMDIGDEEFDCPMPEAVVAEVLPEDFKPESPPLKPEGAGRAVYERWTISFCGNDVPFLLTFWTMEQGGTAFDLNYPFRETTMSAADGAAMQLQ